MAITFPISCPATPGFTDLRWQPRSAVGESESEFTYKLKQYVWPGQARSIVATLPPMSLANAKLWEAWAYSLNGREGSFYFGDSVGKTAQGVGTGTPLVKGASQTGQDLITDGWTISTAGILKKGDWISIADRLYSVLVDATSDGSGNATLTLFPKLRTAPTDDTPILVGANARGIFKLIDWPEMGWDVNRLRTGFKFTAKEYIQ